MTERAIGLILEIHTDLYNLSWEILNKILVKKIEEQLVKNKKKIIEGSI